MRRQLAIAAFCTAVLIVPVLAQMHGGSRGGGAMGRGGFSSSGSVGFRGGSSLGVGPRSGVVFGTGLRQPAFRSGRSFSGFRQPFLGSRRFPGSSFGSRRFRRQFSFSSFSSPFFFGYSGYPYYDSAYSYASADYYPAYDYYASSNAAQNDIAQQQRDIDRLEDEVARLREQRESERQESREAPTPQVPSKSIISTPTLLVFRDKHTQEVQNYAIVGGTLWIFSEQKATKLPLSWLDIDATTKVNDERGVDFQVPKSPM